MTTSTSANETAVAQASREPSEKEIRLVIAASSAGTIFEWYDFFIYGTLAGLIGAAFFPSGRQGSLGISTGRVDDNLTGRVHRQALGQVGLTGVTGGA